MLQVGEFTDFVTFVYKVRRAKYCVNITLSFKAVPRTKGVKQQSDRQDRSAPAQVGAEGYDIMQSKTISRQACCQQQQAPKG